MSDYELSVLKPNGDTISKRVTCQDFHDACLELLDYASNQGGLAERIERVPSSDSAPKRVYRIG